MKLLERSIPANCQIMLISDTHEGSNMCHREGIERALDWVMAKRNRYFVHLGDEIDAICSDDKRYQYEEGEDPIPLRQAFAVVEQFTRVRHRGLVWLYGNHPEKLQRFGNLTRDIICRQLGIPYGTWTCKLRLMCGDKQVLKMFLAHGFRGNLSSNAKDEEQRRANLMAGLKRKLVAKAGDCLIMAMGHTHKLIVVPPSRRLILADDGEKIIQSYLSQGDGSAAYIEPDCRWYVNTGSYLKMYQQGTDGYAERAGYDPHELGHAVISIKKGELAGIEPVFA
jgi:predicted phosphodiesterase